VHDENYKVDWSDSDFYVQENSGEYICEKGFFKKYQIKELNKLNKKSEIVHETSENIFEKYYERIKEFDKTEDNKIKLIQPLESIFLLDNSKNTGNTDEYIEILKEVRRSIIEGEKEGLAILENQKEKLKISNEVLEIMERAVKVHEESWDLGIEDFDGNESLQKIKDIQEELDTALNKKEGGSKIWKNKTAPGIVTEIAKKFKLKPIVTPHPMIFSQQSMLNHTYWEKVQELAGRIGYVAQVSGTELHFHPIDKMIDKFITTIPVLSFFDPVGNIWSEFNSQTLDMFKPRVGDYMDKASNSKKDKIVHGVDPVTAKFYSSSKSPTTVGKNLRTSDSCPCG
jgi:hypothetical protein